MNAAKLLDAFSEIDHGLLAEADTFLKTPRFSARPRLRTIAIAATLALLIAIIPIAVILANREPQSPNLPIINGYLSITDIPGATVYSGNDYDIVSNGRNFPLTVKDYISYLKKHPSAVGTATHIATVSVPYTQTLPLFTLQRTLTISVFDLTVTNPINQLKNEKTVRILTCALYDTNGNITMKHGFENLAISAMNQKTGYYVLNDFSKIPPSTGLTQFITVNGVQYDLSQFADYYFSDFYQTDGESFYYFREISFNEIQE